MTRLHVLDPTAALFLLLVVQLAAAFSPAATIFPTTASSTTTCLQSASTSPERTLPKTPAEILAQQGMEEDAPRLFDESLHDDMQNVLFALEKRVNHGPGSLSPTEWEEFHKGSQRILAEMRNFREHEAAPVNVEAAVPPPATTSSTTTTTTPSIPTSKPDKTMALESDPLEVAERPHQTASPSGIPDLPNIVIASAEEAVIQPDTDHLQQFSRDEEPPEDVPEYDAPVATTPEGYSSTDLRIAVSKMDSKTVSDLLDKGLAMDESTTNAAFWAVVKAVDEAEAQDRPLSPDVPRMLHRIFDADLRHLLQRQQIRTNVTCMQPRDDGVEGRAQAMSYIFDDSAHKDLPLTEGRRCEDGHCCDACSRNIFPTFASEAESSLSTFPEIASFTFNDLRSVSSASILQFSRLIERVRRTIAHEYGLPLRTILPLQAYSRKYVAGSTQQGGGGGEGDFVTLHTDEATHSGYHYSCVLYLSTSGEDFEGGDFVFNDPAPADEIEANDDDGDEKEDPATTGEEGTVDYEKQAMELAEKIRRAGRKLTPYSPTRGAAVIFSSGWENMHEVEKITSGVRYAVPCFFTTCPVPEAAYEQMVVGKPETDEEIADDWLHLLLAHRRETPLESMGRVKELLMKWHYMCAPLSEH
jgi:hypothetical protein